jgi:hypothetical protein
LSPVKKLIVGAFLLFFISCGKNTIDSELAKEFTMNYIKCSAYYSILAESKNHSGDTDSADELREIAKYSLFAAEIFGTIVWPDENLKKVLSEKQDWYYLDMKKKVKKDFEKLEILKMNNESFCKELGDSTGENMYKVSHKTGT